MDFPPSIFELKIVGWSLNEKKEENLKFKSLHFLRISFRSFSEAIVSVFVVVREKSH